MSPTVYLVTGANRGIGYEFVKQLSSRPDVIIFAGIRTDPSPGSPLAKLIQQLPEVVVPVKITAVDESNNKAAAKEIKGKVGKVDVLIASAGVMSPPRPLSEISPDDMRSDFEINTLGPLVLYQAFAPLLTASDIPGGAKFIMISSLAGSISSMVPFPVASYGISKAGANYLTKKIDVDMPDIVSFPIYPGIVMTDMSKGFFDSLPVTPEEAGGITAERSVSGMLKVVDQAKKESHGGKFWTYEGEEVQY